MNYSVFIHGNCNGQQAGGAASKGEDGFIEKFYTVPYTYGCQFDIERRETGLIYYSYIRAKNIIAYDGRTAPAAYFAITVKSDAHFADVLLLRTALEMAFENMCLGKILEKKEANFKFTISDFDAQQGLCDSIDGLIAKTLGGAVGLKRCVNDVKSFGAVSGASAKIYSGDATAGYIVSALKQCSHIVIADDIALSKVAGKQFQEMKQQCESKVKAAEEKATQTEQKARQEIENAKRNAQARIDEAERKSAQEIANIRQNAEQDKARIQREADNQIVRIKEEAKREVDNEKQTVAKLNGDLANAKQERENAVALAEKKKQEEINKLQNDIKTLQTQEQQKINAGKEKVRKQYAEQLKKAQEDLATEKANAKKAQEDAQRDINKLQGEINGLKTQNSTLTQNIGSAQKALEDMQQKISAISGMLGKLDSKIEKTEGISEDDKKKLREAIKKISEIAEVGSLNGVVGDIDKQGNGGKPKKVEEKGGKPNANNNGQQRQEKDNKGEQPANRNGNGNAKQSPVDDENQTDGNDENQTNKTGEEKMGWLDRILSWLKKGKKEVRGR